MTQESPLKKILIDIILYISFFLIIGSITFPVADKFPSFDRLLSYSTYLIFGVSTFVYYICCIKFKEKFFNNFDYFLIIFLIIYYYFTWKHGFKVMIPLNTFTRVFTIKYFLTIAIYTHSTRNTLNIFFNTLGFIVILNFILMLIAPGMFGYTIGGSLRFLIAGNHNQFGGFFLFVFAVGIINYYLSNKGFYLIYTIALFSVIYTGSMTSTTCMVILLIFFYFRNSKKIVKTSTKALAIFLPLFFFIYVIPAFTFNMNSLISNYTDFIGKDITFTGRTYIWLNTVDLILKNPLEGFGAYDREWALMIFGRGSTPHNIILNIFVISGLIGFIFYAIINYLVIKNILSIKSAQNINYILLSIYLLYLFMQMFEVYNMIFVISFLYLLYLSPTLLGYRHKKNMRLHKYTSS